MATDLQCEYQIALRVEAMIDADDMNAPDRYHVDDDYWDAATEMLEAEKNGELVRYSMVVILKDVTTSRLDSGRWLYQAFQEKDSAGIPGCIHTVDTMSLKFAMVEAISLHKRGYQCVRKG
jgi:hypothetical protein